MVFFSSLFGLGIVIIILRTREYYSSYPLLIVGPRTGFPEIIMYLVSLCSGSAYGYTVYELSKRI